MSIERFPVVDLAGPRAPALGAVREAARRAGAFYVTNHGLPTDVEARAIDAAHRFFARSLDEKMEVAAVAPARVRGYQPLPRGDGDYKEWFFATIGLAGFTHMPGDNRWPREPADFRAVIEAYMEAFHAVGQTVMSLLAESLGLATDFFHDHFAIERGGGGGLRILRYPPAEQAPPGRFGANAHSDMPPIAMIQQDDAGGLETQLRDGSWAAVAPVPGAIAVQIGDALARWTNDEYLAGVHHVRHARGRDRLSRAFFMVPRADAVIDGLDTCCTPERPRRYPPVTFGQFMGEWILRQRL